MSLLLFVAGQRTAPISTRRLGDDVAGGKRRLVVEIHEPAEEIIRAEIRKPRTKTRKVKREIAQRIIETAGYSGLLGAGIPAPVFSAVSIALDTASPDPRIYEAIAIAMIRAAEEAEDEEIAILLLVA